MAVAVQLAAGTPRRIDTDCPACGWADLWQTIVHTLTSRGVGTAATLTRCARCGTRQPVRRERP